MQHFALRQTVASSGGGTRSVSTGGMLRVMRGLCVTQNRGIDAGGAAASPTSSLSLTRHRQMLRRPLSTSGLSSFPSAVASSMASSAVSAGGLVDRLLRDTQEDRGPSSSSAWVDSPTSIVEDPLHPNGFDFAVDLGRKPALDSGVAAFAAAVASGQQQAVDPFELVQGEITSLSSGIRSLLGSDHPVLEICARYFFEQGRDGGKKVRPTMVLLISLATNSHLASTAATAATANNETSSPSPSGSTPSSSVPLLSFSTAAAAVPTAEGVLASQRRLAEITEMIHTASLFHDDVIDQADTRRGVPAANRAYGDKLAILAGDFLLARASVALARLRNVEVVELLSTVIEHLVKGEVMQMRGGHLRDCSALEYYFHKNYYKTGSLMANSCRAAALLSSVERAATTTTATASAAAAAGSAGAAAAGGGGGGGHLGDRHQPSPHEDAAFAYGKHLGLAFQLVDDVLDFEGSLQSLGKPALADLKAGLATAPVLFAAEEHPRLQALIDRKFAVPGDVDEALALVQSSKGLQRTQDLAIAQADQAIASVLKLQPSPARDALAHLAYKVVTRKS
mmetsp:Transcript_81999/g.163823  ORF Transcript_81999/g.163823 Transcript_81999/m.163823 type:complete len:566 (-) Transcript_81999:269-1966(-)|eukprot:CAMPEP_0171695138 /NCGR_PEP_ID=MMETSP0991-20121206/7600_1 /TAXON_ID=483369 /ORGANISM="non described non described, Strain CCMP2098" /LENGTH=565 /DNA_ID=CAMNT_0012283789 /DNA_START=5 /DNA_END=1702 /DNA_ORIENTATION=-